MYMWNELTDEELDTMLEKDECPECGTPIWDDGDRCPNCDEYLELENNYNYDGFII